MVGFKRRWLSIAALGAVAALTPKVHAQGAVITNGTVSLGVFNTGDLNFNGVGILNNSNGHDGTIAGCPCEGWGVGISGGSNNGVFGGSDASTGQITGALSVVSFTSTASTATSITTISNAAGAAILQITHSYVPSAVPGLYEDDVTLLNLTNSTLGFGSDGILFRRLMDWDIPPTQFDEFVTVQGNGATNLLGTSDDGFETADVFEARRSVSPAEAGANPCAVQPPVDADFSHSGPCDHGALFDFGFPALDAGTSRTFSTFYGVAPSETAAVADLAAVDAEGVYSFGQSSDCDPRTCSEETFIFGFKGVGGTVIPPVTATPEPGSLALLATGLVGIGGFVRRRRSQS